MTPAHLLRTEPTFTPPRRRHGVVALALMLTFAGVSPSLYPGSAAASDTRTERIQFAKGATSATVEGRIKGYETVDYLVGAREGQSANISLGTKHGATYFNILAPGETDEAMFIGSVRGQQFEGLLPADGDYRIRVYMMRSAARRNEVADYRLEVIVSGAPAMQSGEASSAENARAAD